MQARVFTPPLVELTPQTSYGYAVIDFARDVVGEPLDPWECWAVIHGGELLPDGRPRFRHVLLLVARQNGKTHLCKILALFWLFVEQWPMVLGTSTNLEYAKEAWDKTVQVAEDPDGPLASMVAAVLRGNNDIHLRTTDGCKYKIGTASRRGGRSLSIDRLIQDELREHHDWSAWNAATNAMNARPFGQSWSLSNMGDDLSVVLDALRDGALEFIETGQGDPRVGLLEWSAPEGADVMDPEAWAAANPNLGHRLDYDTVRGAALRASLAGGEEESGFRTEILCQRVRSLDAAVDPAAWGRCGIPGELSGVRSRLAGCLDISPDGQHASLCVAGILPDGRARVEAVAGWSGPQAVQALRRELPGWLKRVRPQTLGWFPNGPAAALAADLKERKGRTSWPPPGVKVEEIRSEVTAVCMGFAEQVKAEQVLHSDQPLLNDHVLPAEKLWQGDAWRFSRKGEGHCDAAYAAAGAVHLARTLPTAVGKPRLIVVEHDED